MDAPIAQINPQQPPQPSKVNKLISVSIHALLYFSIFLAGFIAAKVHTLLMSI